MTFEHSIFLFGLAFLFLIQALSVFLAVWCMIEVKAMQKSTHSIQYVPADQSGFEKITEAVTESLNKELFDNVN